ncbi:hypothetical protein PsYK624_030650 [Phanerochaete sordida]|uniref:Uncharacterized protein n=1 Tax=Phanerochaete sordida TaxID=48140 RepID=A0A9P3LAN9_9APHY|nr:hypothetical protein PsYK624_030650 [Phanerochaete sordida]
MATTPSSAAMSRVRSPSSLASSFNYISSPRGMHASDPALSSDDSFESLSEDSSDDDEIVWSVSDLSASFVSSQRDPRSPSIFSEDDFIVLGQPTRPGPSAGSRSSVAPSLSADGLSDAITSLTIEDSSDEASSACSSSRPASQAAAPSKRSRRRKPRKARAAVAAPPPAQVPSAPATPKRTKKNAAAPTPSTKEAASKNKKRNAKAAKAQPAVDAGFGARPIVDDVSEAGDVKAVSLYDDAVQYISSFLSSPTAEAKAKGNLTFLQALIVELGLCSATSCSSEQSFYSLPSLPRSITAAKALIKSSAFLNVGDYLEQRDKGLDALRQIMHPSRKALVKDLGRGKGRRKVPRDLVKNTGLGVLLVTCY